MKAFHRATLLLSSLLTLVGCSGLDLLNVVTPSSGYTAYTDLSYGADDRQKLDVYVPDTAAPGHPVMLFFYGGSWQWGSKSQYRFVGQSFADAGILTIIADYRLYPQSYFPVFMNDSGSALAWVHRHVEEYGGSPDNLFVAGHSAGGYNAIMLAVNSSYIKQAGGEPTWIRGAIGVSGPYDFLPLTDPKLIDLFSHAAPASTQPITYVKAGAPPMLLMNGDADNDVWPRNAINMTAKTRDFHNPVTLKIYPGVDHIGIALSLASHFHSRSPAFADMLDFIHTQTILPAP